MTSSEEREWNRYLAARLRAMLVGADGVDSWHKYGEGYNGLRESVRELADWLYPEEKKP